MSSLRQFCIDTISLLKISNDKFGEVYVNKLMEFYGKFKYSSDVKQKFGIFSSVHGPEFFSTVIECLDGREWLYKSVDNKGKSIVSEYEKNFYDFIKFHRTQD